MLTPLRMRAEAAVFDACHSGQAAWNQGRNGLESRSNRVKACSRRNSPKTKQSGLIDRRNHLHCSTVCDIQDLLADAAQVISCREAPAFSTPKSRRIKDPESSPAPGFNRFVAGGRLLDLPDRSPDSFVHPFSFPTRMRAFSGKIIHSTFPSVRSAVLLHEIDTAHLRRVRERINCGQMDLFQLIIIPNYKGLLMKIPKGELERRMSLFRQTLVRSGIKITQQRIEIFREVASSGDHPDADTTYRKVRRKIPTVSLDTVYRNLWLFTELRLLTTLGTFRKRARFDANTESHHHFVCLHCGATKDFYCEEFDRLQGPDSIREWGKPESSRVEIHGVCLPCHKKNVNRSNTFTPTRR